MANERWAACRRMWLGSIPGCRPAGSGCSIDTLKALTRFRAMSGWICLEKVRHVAERELEFKVGFLSTEY
jgi:hypothetical protein